MITLGYRTGNWDRIRIMIETALVGVEICVFGKMG